MYSQVIRLPLELELVADLHEPFHENHAVLSLNIDLPSQDGLGAEFVMLEMSGMQVIKGLLSEGSVHFLDFRSLYNPS